MRRECVSEVCVCARRREVERNEVLGDWIRNRASNVELLPHSEERKEKEKKKSLPLLERHKEI